MGVFWGSWGSLGGPFWGLGVALGVHFGAQGVLLGAFAAQWPSKTRGGF